MFTLLGNRILKAARMGYRCISCTGDDLFPKIVEKYLPCGAAACYHRRMKRPKALLIILVLISFVGSALAADTPTQGRTIKDLNVIPTRVLKRSISPKFFKTLLISPVKGWVVVRGNLSGARISGARVVRSDLKGEFDALALKLAKEVQIAGDYAIDRPNRGGSVLMHLLIYQIADGTMALSFPHLDGPGGDHRILWLRPPGGLESRREVGRHKGAAGTSRQRLGCSGSRAGK